MRPTTTTTTRPIGGLLAPIRPPPLRPPPPPPQRPARPSRAVEAYVAIRQQAVDEEWRRRRDAAMLQTARRLGIRSGPQYNAADLIQIMADTATREQFDESNRWRAGEIRRLYREGSERLEGGRTLTEDIAR